MVAGLLFCPSLRSLTMTATAVQTRGRKGPKNFAEAKSLGRLLTVEEMAPLLGLTAARLYEIARQKLIPHVRIGRQVKLSAAKCEEWVESGGTALPGGWKRKADK
jgi:putative molybdopterin biosynthesis protein